MDFTTHVAETPKQDELLIALLKAIKPITELDIEELYRRGCDDSSLLTVEGPWMAGNYVTGQLPLGSFKEINNLMRVVLAEETDDGDLSLRPQHREHTEDWWLQDGWERLVCQAVSVFDIDPRDARNLLNQAAASLASGVPVERLKQAMINELAAFMEEVRLARLLDQDNQEE